MSFNGIKMTLFGLYMAFVLNILLSAVNNGISVLSFYVRKIYFESKTSRCQKSKQNDPECE